MQPNTTLTPEEIKTLNTISINFIVGKERSGTTLLQVMLNSHPNITAPPESRFIMFLYSRYGNVKQWTEPLITDFCNDLFREKLFANFWKVDKDELLACCLAAKDFLTYPLICKIVFYFENPQKQVKLFLDKNPIYYYFLPGINRIFPDAKYIHLVRDYRANLVSHRRVFSMKNVMDIAYRWMKVNMLIEKAKSRNPQKFFTLKYESFVTDPAGSLKEVCRFLEIPYEEKMALDHTSGIYSSFNSNVKKGFRKIHSNVFNPVTSSYIDEWRKTLSTDDISLAEAMAGDYAEKMYGYKMTHPQPAAKTRWFSIFMVKLKYRIIRKIYRIAFANPWLYRIIKRYIWITF